MDILFGSVGFSDADAERMREINREIGLDAMVHTEKDAPTTPDIIDEKKMDVQHKESEEL